MKQRLFNLFILKLFNNLKLLNRTSINDFDYLDNLFHRKFIQCNKTTFLLEVNECNYYILNKNKNLRIKIVLKELIKNHYTYKYLHEDFLEIVIKDNDIFINNSINLNSNLFISFYDLYLLYKGMQQIINKIEHNQKNVLEYFGFTND